MKRERLLSSLQRLLISLAVPRDRLDEVMGDLEDGYRTRRVRLGEPAARRHLRREVASLVLWRLRWWQGASLTRKAAKAGSTRSTTLGRDFVLDLRFGLRTLGRKPLFTLTAVGVLGLGIGAPTTVFTVVNSVFFQHPEHISDPDRLVRLTRSFGPGRGGGALGNPDYLHYRENASTLSGLAAYGEFRAVSYTTDGQQSDQLDLLFVSDNFFDVLGVPLARGRGFSPEENATPGTHPVVILNHDFWIRALGGDPNVVGASLILAGTPCRIVGVATQGFGAVTPVAPAPDVWVPIAMYGKLTRAPSMDWWQRLPNMRSRWLVGLGRLAPGVTFEAAQANLVGLGESLVYEGKSEDEGAFLQRQFLYSPRLEATLASLSRMLLVVVGIVFLVAAFNAAVLLLSRATTRFREMGIRTALGAGRERITRQILVEALLLGLAGGLLGLALAYLLSDVAASLLPVSFAVDFRPDARILLAVGALSLLTAVGVGLLPALRVTGGDVRKAIQDPGDGVSGYRTQDALVVGQVALSLVLVAGALLFGRSFWAARSQEVGFATEDRLVVQVPLVELGYEPEESRAFVNQALEGIRQLPGVMNAAATRMIPFQGDWSTEFEAPPGAQPNYEENKVFTGLNAVSPGYFSVAGIPLVSGRGFQAHDVPGGPSVTVLNQTLARDLWPGEDPVGRSLPIDESTTLTVVGVVRDASYYELGEEPAPQAYLSLSQFPQRSVHFLVHTSGSSTEMAPLVRGTLRELEPRIVFRWETTMASMFEDETARYEVSAILVAVFSAVALLLAATGLYGTLSFLVARRTREIGVKMALGAARQRVAADVMRSGLRLAGVGVVLGMVAVLLLRRFTESLLYQIPPTDPLPLLGGCLVLLLVTLAATWTPARRATRVDPMEAIRTE